MDNKDLGAKPNRPNFNAGAVHSDVNPFATGSNRPSHDPQAEAPKESEVSLQAAPYEVQIPQPQPQPLPNQPPLQPQIPQGPPGQNQGYGPQFNLPPVQSGRPGGGTGQSHFKKILLIIGGGGLVLVGGLLAFVLLTSNKKTPEAPVSDEITQQYDSPIGLIPDFRGSQVPNGSFKLTASYVGDGDFVRTGNFYVADHKIYFDMLPDAKKVNVLLKQLYTKTDAAATYTDEGQGALRNLTYDFASLLHYNYLYDKNATFGGFIPMVEAARADAKVAAKNKLLKLGPSCDTALSEVKDKTGDNINTKSVRFDYSQDGQKSQATVSFASRQAIDKTVVAFFDNCFDLQHKDATTYKKFVDSLREKTTPSPTFSYWQENGVWNLTVSAPAKDTSFGGALKFELTKLGQVAGKLEGRGASYAEPRNKYGLAYSLCRTTPVVKSVTDQAYRFVVEDTAYRVPTELDTGYYCTTLSVPSEFAGPTNMSLRLANNKKVAVSGASNVNAYRAVHDLVYEAEKFNLDNKRYPGPTEFTDLASNNLDELTSVAEKLLAGKGLVYTPTPAQCVGSCKSYSMTHLPRSDAQFKYPAY